MRDDDEERAGFEEIDTPMVAGGKCVYQGEGAGHGEAGAGDGGDNEEEAGRFLARKAPEVLQASHDQVREDGMHTNAKNPVPFQFREVWTWVYGMAKW